jgi:predicted phosphodiesterase
MKTLIFSDTHASHHLNLAQLALLRRVIHSADRVVINGDFWDRYITTFDTFVKSGWKELFPLLKQRKTIYLVGNHDIRESIDKRWRLFANRIEDSINLTIGSTTYHIEHGHGQAYSFNFYYPKLTRLFSRVYPYLDKIEQGGHVLSKVYQAYLRKAHDDHELLSYAKAHKQKNLWHVFGHTHMQRRSVAEHYLNPGSFRCGVGNWLIIDGDGTSTLHTETYG